MKIARPLKQRRKARGGGQAVRFSAGAVNYSMLQLDNQGLVVSARWKAMASHAFVQCTKKPSQPPLA